MPRYFFHLRDGKSLPDRAGTELPDVGAAKLRAVRLAGERLKEDDGAFWKGEEWQMEVVDCTGLVLFTLDFIATESPAMRAAQKVAD
ncbi:DUF6894 family protein [Roseomonas populi]|uniref:DUF6894 domain-containing protein n=1 Tax=Roseomonas populi TaxID=3121582 RepID=A0ABT1X0B2_9PROT|nr:hypothetical protein [Roseomonas pecuniae]MCR0981540.1 hypothetical protein [Roseomonas pecuniae]